MSITNTIAAYGALYAITECAPTYFLTRRTKPPQRRATSMRARRKIRMASMEPPSPWKRICRLAGQEARQQMVRQIMDSLAITSHPPGFLLSRGGSLVRMRESELPG